MSNSNPQLKQYIREQLTNRLFESVENISEAGQYRPRVPTRSINPNIRHESPNPATPRPTSMLLNLALTAGLAGNQAIQSATDEWNQNKEKGILDDENTQKTAWRALVSGGLESAVAYGLVSGAQKIAAAMPARKRYRAVKGPGAAASGAVLAYLAGRGIDSQMDKLTNMTDNPESIKNFKRKKAQEEDKNANEDRRIKREQDREALGYPPRSSNNTNQQIIATKRMA